MNRTNLHRILHRFRYRELLTGLEESKVLVWMIWMSANTAVRAYGSTAAYIRIIACAASLHPVNNSQYLENGVRYDVSLYGSLIASRIQSFQSIPKSVTLNDRERRYGHFVVIYNVQHSPTSPPYRGIGTPTPNECSVSLAPTSLHPKQDVDPFSRFCSEYVSDCLLMIPIFCPPCCEKRGQSMLPSLNYFGYLL